MEERLRATVGEISTTLSLTIPDADRRSEAMFQRCFRIAPTRHDPNARPLPEEGHASATHRAVRAKRPVT